MKKREQKAQQCASVAQVSQVLCWNSFRVLIFQQGLVPAPARGHWPTRATCTHVQAFLNENVYLVLMWMRMLAFPTGLALDVAITAATLGVALAGNGPFCAGVASAGNGPFYAGVASAGNGLQAATSALATQQEPFRSSAQRAASCFLAVLSVLGGIWGSSAPLPSSCSSLLAFWEVLGWWIACVTVTVREVVCRMAFVRAQVSSRTADVGALELSLGTGPLISSGPGKVLRYMIVLSVYSFFVLLGTVLFLVPHESSEMMTQTSGPSLTESVTPGLKPVTLGFSRQYV